MIAPAGSAVVAGKRPQVGATHAPCLPGLPTRRAGRSGSRAVSGHGRGVSLRSRSRTDPAPPTSDDHTAADPQPDAPDGGAQRLRGPRHPDPRRDRRRLCGRRRPTSRPSRRPRPPPGRLHARRQARPARRRPARGRARNRRPRSTSDDARGLHPHVGAIDVVPLVYLDPEMREARRSPRPVAPPSCSPPSSTSPSSSTARWPPSGAPAPSSAAAACPS